MPSNDSSMRHFPNPQFNLSEKVNLESGWDSDDERNIFEPQIRTESPASSGPNTLLRDSMKTAFKFGEILIPDVNEK